MSAYTRCTECGEAFRFTDSDGLEPECRERVARNVAWIVPPWTQRCRESEFELSWDDVERDFRAQRAANPELAPMVGLIGDLREAGLGPRLRAGQSASSLVLSRSIADGVREGQRFVALDPQPGGAVKIRALLARELSFGPVPASYGGDLKLVVDALLSAEID